MTSQPPHQRTGFRNIVDPDDARRYREAGWWSDTTFADAVGLHAERQGDKPAYATLDHRLTYRQLDEAADRVAATLVASGAEPGVRAAVLLPDGPTIHAVFLGAERAGVTVIGIGARAGEQEIRYLLGKTGADTMITHAEHRGEDQAALIAGRRADGVDIRRHVVVPRFETGDVDIVVDGDRIDPAPLTPEAAAERCLGPDDLFLVNSTSGTTGMPKCVQHFQNRWGYFHRKAVEHGDLTGDDVFLSAVPTPFGFGLWTSHVSPLMLGATSAAAERFDAQAVLELIERERVSVFCCVSTQFIMLLGTAEVDKRDLSSLRVMFTGGEAVPFERARQFEEQTGATVLQFYGSNETGMLSGTTLSDDADRRLRTAGRAADEMEVRLFENGRDVTASGRGQPGCRGPATSVGYLDDDAANRELFTDDGWMLMGDICTMDDDRYLSVVGRTSDLIIRGGKNISAPQVEAEVATHPDVVHVAAVSVPDPVFGERVGVYVQLRPGATLDLDGLCAHLVAGGVSKEIYPEHLFVLDELPLSSGGKVAKGALREDAKQRAASPARPS